MADVELLPCPFCGAPAERIDFGPGDAENAGGSCISCTQCQASGPVEFGYKENFISNWNRRTAPPSAPVGVEGLLADLETIWHSVSDDKETNAAYERLKIALAQQPTDPVRALIALAERAAPFLLDEAANYDDDGSNEPLELAREIESVLAELAGLRVTVNKTDTE